MGNQHIKQFILPYWKFLTVVRDGNWALREQMVDAWHDLKPKEKEVIRTDFWKFIELLNRNLEAFRDDLEQYRDCWEMAVNGDLTPDEVKSVSSLEDVYSNYLDRLDASWNPVRSLMVSSTSVSSDTFGLLNNDLFRPHWSEVLDLRLAHAREVMEARNSFTARASDLPKI